MGKHMKKEREKNQGIKLTETDILNLGIYTERLIEEDGDYYSAFRLECMDKNISVIYSKKLTEFFEAKATVELLKEAWKEKDIKRLAVLLSTL